MNNQARSNLFIASAVFLAVFILSGCSDSPTKTPPSTYNSSKVNIPTKTVPVSPPIRQQAPIIEDSELVDYEPQTFKGSACTGDCSGHEAGYDWAEEKDIDDPSDCGGNSNSFIEGCESYAEEQQELSDEYEE